MSEDRRQISSCWTLDKGTFEEAAASTVLSGNMIAMFPAEHAGVEMLLEAGFPGQRSLAEGDAKTARM